MLTETAGVFGTHNYTLQSKVGFVWCLEAQRGTRKQPTGLVPTLGCPQLVLGREKGEGHTISVWLEKGSCELSWAHEQRCWGSSSKSVLV